MDKYEGYIGQLLDDRYLVESIIGEGGMAVVMKAQDTLENRPVAVKMLSDESMSDEGAVQRFVNESKAISMLSHPNIVRVFDVHVNEDRKYIIMEYIAGVTLKEYIDKKGRLEWKEATHYILQILSALSQAHAKGIIHRDIKPQNIMLLKDGSVKVTDFGIAKLPDSKSITVTNKAIGTVNYISPEQASGKGSSVKSDIYSTGVMLYEMVTGKLPFISESAVSVAMMHVSTDPVMPTEISPGIPDGLEQIIIKAMKKSPELRFGSAKSMQKTLEFLLLNPEVRFKENVVLGPDGKPYRGTFDDGVTRPAPIAGENEEKETKGSGSMLPIVLGVTLAFFTVVVICLLVAINKFGIADIFMENPVDTEENTLVVPSLVGETYTEWLEEELKKDGFNLNVEYIFNRDAEKYEILSQEPEAKAERKITGDGVKLKILVNSGASDRVLEDYSITDAREAALSLTSAGLVPEIIEEFNDTVISGYVIRTEPEAGMPVSAGDTVRIFASKGQEKVTVKMPQVIGMTAAQAERELIKKGISVGDRSYAPSENYPEGVVISQSIAADTEVVPKTVSVNIVICKNEVIEEIEEIEEITQTEEAAEAPAEETASGGLEGLAVSDANPFGEPAAAEAEAQSIEAPEAAESVPTAAEENIGTPSDV